MNECQRERGVREEIFFGGCGKNSGIARGFGERRDYATLRERKFPVKSGDSLDERGKRFRGEQVVGGLEAREEK
jgi:hypothetical protein